MVGVSPDASGSPHRQIKLTFYRARLDAHFPFTAAEFAANAGHLKNPNQLKLLAAKMVSDTKSPGVGPDLV
jgi:hypothetical protein